MSEKNLATSDPKRTMEIEARKFAARPKRTADTSSPHDQLNKSIISRLQRDGRMPFAEIAQELDVSEGTIRNRVNSMKQAGMLHIAAIADPIAVEYKTEAMIGLTVSSGFTPQDVAERLSPNPDIVYILWVSGRYDLLIEVVSDDHDDFLIFMEKEIHSQADIAAVEIMTGLKNYKNQFLLKRNWK